MFLDSQKVSRIFQNASTFLLSTLTSIDLSIETNPVGLKDTTITGQRSRQLDSIVSEASLRIHSTRSSQNSGRTDILMVANKRQLVSI